MDKSLELIREIKEIFKHQMLLARAMGTNSALIFNNDFQDVHRNAHKNWLLICKIEKVLIDQSLDDVDFENSALKAYLSRFSR